MIPSRITTAQVEEAIRLIIRDGVPLRRRGRDYCLATRGEHLPPKYTIAVAHQVATGELLSPDRFSGGSESNEFLRRRGFAVTECNCGDSVRHGGAPPTSPKSKRKTRTTPSTRHSERCRECKIRVKQLLGRIYGACLRDHRFQWETSLTAYVGTPIGSVLRDVAGVLEGYRGYGIGAFVRSKVLAGCDYWVPDAGFVVEFDESQHFTRPRKLALSVYPDAHPLGFPTRRWRKLCEHHDARDNTPPFRDEQRAWYDTLRDLVPSVRGLQATVRLYARDRVWCSLDPESRADRECFSNLIHDRAARFNKTTVRISSSTARPESTLRVAMVFPQVVQRTSNGVPPAGAQEPDVPAADSFASEDLDFALFPESYISASDRERSELLTKLAADLDAPLLVGAIDRTVDSTDRAWQVLLRFDPDGSRTRVYTKHSTADAVAFERPDWKPNSVLPTFELSGVTAGATICHDHYLGLFPRALARRGARLWVNPSFDNVRDIKWSSILRLRAVENRFFSLCTLHYDVNRKKTHPFAFSPDGAELWARQAGSDDARALSECSEAGNIYVVELDMTKAGEPLDWSEIPSADKPKRPRTGKTLKPISVALRDGQPVVLASSGRETDDSGFRVETAHGPVYVGVVPSDRILDAAACFKVLDRAKAHEVCSNHLESLGAASRRLGAARDPHDG